MLEMRTKETGSIPKIFPTFILKGSGKTYFPY